MKKQMSKVSTAVLGFVAGVAFLISCGGGGSTGSNGLPGIEIPINDAGASGLPVITDQMYCTTDAGSLSTATPATIQNQNNTNQLACMKQSTKVFQFMDNLSNIYAEGWIMISMQTVDSDTMAYLFYK